MRTLIFTIVVIGLMACTPSKKVNRSNNAALTESVEVGYGSKSKRELTTSVGQVETDDNNLTLDVYLRRVAGVQVSGNGRNARIKIRGINTINSNLNEPLYVIDGSPMGNSFAQVFDFVDVNDIRSVSVLKDGASSSMYGTRGSNGVILIKTKSK